MLRSSVVAEMAGVRSVSIVCSGFLQEAEEIAKMNGLPGISLAEYTGHVSMDSDSEFTEKVSRNVVDKIIEGLCDPK